MKRLLKRLLPTALLVTLLLVISGCGEEPTPPAHTHSFGEWTVTEEPTYEKQGSRSRVCSGCDETETEAIPCLTASYYITVTDGDDTYQIPLGEDGAYTLTPTERIGYEFLGYFDASDMPFPLTGTVTADVAVTAKYQLLPTTTFLELKARIEAGADVMVASDILLSETVFVTDDVTLFSAGAYTLKRAEGFLGDLFVVGTAADGKNPILEGKTASLTVRPSTGASLVFDGNKAAFANGVLGTAFMLENSASLNIYDGVEIKNCYKTGNDRIFTAGKHVSDPALAGGAAVIVISGDFNMYGGAIRGCEVDMDDSAVTDDALQTEGYNNSSRGGAVFNYGTFRMLGGVIENCRAGRGGALYNYRVMYLTGGTVQNNHSASYGGAFYNPNSQYVYAVLGDVGTEIVLTVSGNTAGKSGGAIYSSHQGTVYVRGGTLFTQNAAQSGNGGAINAAGAVIVDYAEFVKNTASSKGGAIYAYYNAPGYTVRIVELKSGLFAENEAPRGGALGFSCGDDTTVGARAEIGDVIFLENKAPLTSSGKYGYGAAIHIDQASIVSIYGNAKFQNNASSDNGGAIYVTKASTLDVCAETGVTVTFEGNNSTAGNGGAIYNSGSTVKLTAKGGTVLFKKNAADEEKGGAIAVHSGGTAYLSGVVFTENSAGSGGALYLYGGNAVVGDQSASSACTFTLNKADKGGAIYVEATDSNPASLTATELILSQNEATGNGGALYVYTNASVNIGVLKADNNMSDSYGGVMYISGKAVAVIDRIEATGNSASSGGCIYLTTGETSLTLNGGDIRGNTASTAAKGNAVWVNAKSSVLRLKTDAEENILLLYTEGEILGKSGFAITKYQEVAG